MSRKTFLAIAATALLATNASADLTIEVGTVPLTADQKKAVTQFQTDYMSGSGLTYVRMPNENGQLTLYRYGNGSRNGVHYVPAGQAPTYWLYTCSGQRRIVLPDDSAAIAAASPQFIRMGDVGYEAAEEEYGSFSKGCYNPWVWGMTSLNSWTFGE